MAGDIGFVHSDRYPKHEGPKGQMFGGECNRTACTRHGARFYNRHTFGLYCGFCAEAINMPDDILPTCIEVDEKPDRDGMGYHMEAWVKAYAKNRERERNG